MTIVTCHVCGSTLKKDHIALNKKLFGRQIKKLFCLPCMADYLGCTVDDLYTKIEEFKEQGCMLFG